MYVYMVSFNNRFATSCKKTDRLMFYATQNNELVERAELNRTVLRYELKYSRHLYTMSYNIRVLVTQR